jgi:hypothetical protein
MNNHIISVSVPLTLAFKAERKGAQIAYTTSDAKLNQYDTEIISVERFVTQQSLYRLADIVLVEAALL